MNAIKKIRRITSMSAFLSECIQNDPLSRRSLQKIEKKGILTLFFFLVISFSNFYLIESLGKAFNFDRAKKFIDVSSKPKSLFNSYFASIFPITKKKWKIQLRLEINFLSLSMDSLLILIQLEVLIQFLKIMFRNSTIQFFNL